MEREQSLDVPALIQLRFWPPAPDEVLSHRGT